MCTDGQLDVFYILLSNSNVKCRSQPMVYVLTINDFRCCIIKTNLAYMSYMSLFIRASELSLYSDSVVYTFFI